MLPASIESHPIARAWTPAVAERYRRFARSVAGGHELEVTIGRGGLSFYAHSDRRRTFVCHFNATPRAGRDELGFADFQPRAVAPPLDADTVLADLQRRLGATIALRAGKAWCGAHFASERDADVATAFRQAIVDAVLGPAEAVEEERWTTRRAAGSP